MIKVPNPIPEPDAFDEDCRQNGLEWLALHPAPARPKDLWSLFRDDLAGGFSWRCGYKAMINTEGTVDHFMSCDTDRTQAYEWDNYRYISGNLNSSKKTIDAAVLDPFEVEDNWFEVTLPDFQLHLTAAVPADMQAKAVYTIDRLHLRNGPNIIRRRRYWYDRHLNHGLVLLELLEFAPLVGRAVERWIVTHGLPLPPLPPPR